MHARTVLLPCILILAACSSSDGDGGGGGSGGTASDAGAGGAASGGAASGGAASGGAASGGAASGGAASGGAAGDGDAGPCEAPATSAVEAQRVYAQAWGEKNAARRLCLLQRSMTDDATYVDPTVDTTSSAALADAIGDFQTTFPGASITDTTGLDARDGELRFGWDFVNAGASVVKGEDYMEIAPDGRISSVRGYWEPYPAAVAHPALDAYLDALVEDDGTAREADLGDAVAETVRFTAPGGVDATGLTDLSTALGGAGVASVTETGRQIYPKYLRVALTLTLGDGGTVNVTDYAHVGADGKLTRIARFEGDLLPLPSGSP